MDSKYFPRKHSRCFQCNLVPSKGALKVLPKIAVAAVPPKRVLDIKKISPVGEEQAGRIRVAFQMPMNGWGKVNPRYWTNVNDKICQTVISRQAP